MITSLKAFIYLAATLGVSWLNLAAAAAATKRDDGDEPGTVMSIGDSALIFGGIPLAVAALLMILIWAPSRGRSKSTQISNY